MIDKWFQEELDIIFKKHDIAVFIDESKEAEFLLESVKNIYNVYKVDEYDVKQNLSELKELKVKYEIEKNNIKGSKFLLYTKTPKEKLKFIREYCESKGCIEIKHLENYIKQKVHNSLNLNISLSKEEIISAAKLSFGKTQTYWIDLSHKGSAWIFDMEKDLLPFLNSPEEYVKKIDKTIKETFYKKVNELLEQEYIEKPATTLAKEVVDFLLKGLAYNNVNTILKTVYKSWLDSSSKKASFIEYLKKFNLPSDVDIWNVNISHPFEVIDEKILKELGDNLSDKEKLKKFNSFIDKRAKNTSALALKINFWSDIKILINFDETSLNNLSSFNDCVIYYTNDFYKIDRAIRKLYTKFLNKKELLEPFQEYYKKISSIFLDKWFRYFDQYKQNQTGSIKRIIEENDSKIAIIEGDGVSYEISMSIIEKVSKDYKVNKQEKNYLLADIPSETENNMSQLYISLGTVLKSHPDRRSFLTRELENKDIGFVNLEDVNEGTDKHQYLICAYKDIDDMGEKLQQKALKFISEIEDVFSKKIELLLKNKYQKVYLLTDHGFVLTGILNESDKIEINFKGEIKKSERYIRTVNKQEKNDFLFELEKSYENYNYLYFAKSMNPFKTTGKYGYSHGGISPQELIIPMICWENSEQETGNLSISITNKLDLSNITGDVFQIKLKAKSLKDDFFSQERKIVLLFFSKGIQINKSDVITIKKDEEIKKDYDFDGKKELEIKVLDSITKEQLDKVAVMQNNARDLGGLF